MVKNIIKILIGILMITSVLIGYIPHPEYIVELTCISNTLGGLLLIADGILNIAKKIKVPHSFYRNIAVSILTVFLVCMGSLTGIYKFNFAGAFFFLHVINPVAFVVCYMVFINEKESNPKAVLTAPVMMMIYLLFDCIRCQFTSEFVYGFVKPEELTVFYGIMAGIGIYVFMCLLGLCIFNLNRLVHKKDN